MIIGTFLGSFVTFLQVLIDPVEYLSLQTTFICELYKCKSRILFIAAGILLMHLFMVIVL